MSDLAERLRAALAGRYDVERELGARGDHHFVMLSGGAGRSTLIGLQHAFDRLAPTP